VRFLKCPYCVTKALFGFANRISRFLKAPQKPYIFWLFLAKLSEVSTACKNSKAAIIVRTVFYIKTASNTLIREKSCCRQKNN
jgi:hypothetical protein